MALAVAARAHSPAIQGEKNVRAGVAAAKDQQLTQVEFPGGHCHLYLLAQEDVHKDLCLSADQVRKIREFVVDLIEKKRTLKFKEHAQQLGEHQQSALGLLTQDQVQRLQQVSLQYKATASFWDELVRRKLDISDEQYATMRAAPYEQVGGKGRAEELAGIRRDFFDYPKRTEEEWQTREWRRIEVLTPTQRKKWKEMLGKPFKGTVPSAVLVPVAGRARGVTHGEPSIEELKAEIKTLREKLGQIEKRLSQIEKGGQR
jgi:hypothetical protein